MIYSPNGRRLVVSYQNLNYIMFNKNLKLIFSLIKIISCRTLSFCIL